MRTFSSSENIARTPPAPFARRARAELRPLDEQHVLHAGLGQVERDARADHPAADDHHGGLLHAVSTLRDMSITETRTVGSIIGGEAAARAAGGSSRAIPRTSTTWSARPLLGDADAFVDACRAARAAQREWAAVPAPVRGNVDQADRPPRGGQQGGARAARHARDRQALPGVARRGPGDHRHLRLLPLGGPPPLRPDRSERDAGQAAVHLPQAGGRGGDHHRRELPGGGALVVPGAGDPVRQRRGLEAGRVRARAGRRARASCSSPAACRTACFNLVQSDGPTAFEGLERALDEGLVDKVGFTGSSAVGSQDRRAHRPPRSVAPASSWAARTRSW